MKKLVISINSVKALNPCQDRFSNFELNYPDFKGPLSDFLSLDLITYNDKIWVLTRSMSQNQKFQFAVACADSVLEIYYAKYNNPAVRELVDKLKLVEDVTKLTEEQRQEFRTLRKAAAYAAYAAADNAAYAAYAAADNAAYAAAYAAYAAAYAAYAAADNAAYAAREIQQELNLMLAKQVLEEVE